MVSRSSDFVSYRWELFEIGESLMVVGDVDVWHLRSFLTRPRCSVLPCSTLCLRVLYFHTEPTWSRRMFPKIPGNTPSTDYSEAIDNSPLRWIRDGSNTKHQMSINPAKAPGCHKYLNLKWNYCT